MTRLIVICEGYTEKAFVDQCIQPHLLQFQVDVCSTLIGADTNRQGGGGVTIDRLAQHIKNVYRNFDYITTFVDMYGLKGRKGRTKREVEDAIQTTIKNYISKYDKDKVIPYVQQHEYESLLFSNVQVFQYVDGWNEAARRQMEEIVRQNRPEDINDGEETAPSKRIVRVFGSHYNKYEIGPLLAELIGVDCIRRECPCFDEWLTKLEHLPNG